MHQCSHRIKQLNINNTFEFVISSIAAALLLLFVIFILRRIVLYHQHQQSSLFSFLRNTFLQALQKKLYLLFHILLVIFILAFLTSYTLSSIIYFNLSSHYIQILFYVNLTFQLLQLIMIITCILLLTTIWLGIVNNIENKLIKICKTILITCILINMFILIFLTQGFNTQQYLLFQLIAFSLSVVASILSFNLTRKIFIGKINSLSDSQQTQSINKFFKLATGLQIYLLFLNVDQTLEQSVFPLTKNLDPANNCINISHVKQEQLISCIILCLRYLMLYITPLSLILNLLQTSNTPIQPQNYQLIN